MKIYKYLTLKKIGILFLAISLFTSCSDDSDTVSEITTTETETDVDDNDSNNTDTSVSEIGENHEEDTDYIWDSSNVVYITLNGSSITVDGEGATVSNTTVTIDSAGNYEITGTLNDGQIIVDTDDDATVRLILNEIDVTSSSSAPINIASSKKTIVILSENTTNILTDASNYVYENDEDEPNAALFSDDALTIYGEGTLIVNANYNDGIASKDGLIIAGGIININAVDDGIRGKDYLIIKNSDITVNAEGDGLIADNDEDTNNGWIIIESGEFNITADGDGIVAESNVEITYGDFTIETGGGSSGYLSSSDSAKGIKASIDILIEDGIFDINSSDDNIHASYGITINSGTFNLASGDDSIHTDDTIEINGGEINITNAVEGIESPNITINNGNFDINTSDDALNAAGNTNNFLYINGGYIVINCSGDGLDSNGNLTITAGTVILNGPTAQNNSPLDCDGTLSLDGGFLVATGYASNMDEAGNNSSDQYSVLVKLSSTQSAGNLFHIEDSSGNNILTFEPEKNYKSIVFSTPELSTGSYKIYLGGSSTGTETDGVYQNGTYSSGTLYKSFTISSKSTTVN
ncbi:protein of unknown function [Lutibacter oricola]|uniref:Carbohydrate-binding domain-containing protein n=1 Tax=Lutibacter oricola TaxID=762486 RepID=A0A1H2RKA9_9FLAO|nr:carbohydrate-binding domain-containing protein [Lutibacter oricola]SDW19745.1 protein of unknown function [Lutibacter oricola]